MYYNSYKVKYLKCFKLPTWCYTLVYWHRMNKQMNTVLLITMSSGTLYSVACLGLQIKSCNYDSVPISNTEGGLL